MAKSKPAPKIVREHIWLVSAVLFAAGAIGTVLMLPATYALTVTHLAENRLLSQGSASFITASRPVFDLELRWFLAGLLAVSAVWAVLHLKRRLEGRHWADMALSAVVMTELSAILAGYTDLAVLKLMGTAIFVSFGLSWLAEARTLKAKRPDWIVFGMALFAGAMPWLMIGVAKTATLFYGEIRAPWYGYAACLAAFIGFGMIMLNQWNYYRNFKKADAVAVERNYSLLNNAAKLAFGLILIIGTLK